MQFIPSRPFRPILSLALGLALSVSAHAASDDGTKPDEPKSPRSILETRIPIPHEPPAANNGCRLRASPAERETGASNEIPFWSLIEQVNLHASLRVIIDGREGFAKLIAPLDEDARTLATLYMLWHYFGREGLHTFLGGEAGDAAPLVRDALKAAGMTRELDVFTRAMALFGKDYPLDRDTRWNFYGWSRPSTQIDAVTSRPAPLNAFDYRMMALAREFGSKADLAKRITTFVESKPALWQRIEGERAHLNEQDRLRILTSALWKNMVSLWRPYPEIEKRLASFPRSQRTMLVMSAFNDEFRNGGVHQFFYNSEGALAPEVRDAMIEMGMTAQAAILQRGLDMIAKPYVRDTQRRRESYFHGDGRKEWGERLAALTDELYALDGGLAFHQIKDSMVVEGGPGIEFAMLNYARSNRLLPC